MNKILSYAWAFMYLLCAGLGLIQEPVGLAKVALVVIAVLFFLPPALLLYNNIRYDRPGNVKKIRRICIVSLSLTTILLVVFLLLTLLYASNLVQPRAVNISYYLLLAVSSPLFCGQYFFLSLFLWAALLFATFIKKPGQKNPAKKKKNKK